MTLATTLLRRAMRLPSPRTTDVVVDRGVAVPMPDGVVLRHDHHHPAGAGPGPVVLVRSPYGRGSPVGTVFGRLVAERGLHVVVQSVRGTADSQGELAPFDEADDGVATVRWLEAQAWCDGRLATLGPSYLGLTQWALAPDAGPALKAMGTMVTAAQFRDQTYPGGAFSLDNALSWAALVTAQARGPLASLARQLGVDRRAARAMATHPLSDADTDATGAPVGFFQDWLREDSPTSEYWARRDYAGRVGEVGRRGVAVSMSGGWQDIFLPWQLADHAALRAAGAHPRLVIGPWTHASGPGIATGLREALALFDRTFADTPPGPADHAAAHHAAAHHAAAHHAAAHHAAAHHPGGPPPTDAANPVTVELSGAGGRRSLADWPPPATPTPWYLRTDHSLSHDAPESPTGDLVRWQGTHLVYDPADPTPAVGGPILAGRSGYRDQTALEARADVAVWTGPVLAGDLVALGPARAVVHVRSDAGHLDVFVRVCDVDPSGRSVNVTDGLRRLVPGDPAPTADGARRVEIPLWPTGHRFAAGHRVRVQVSGGAHPRFARNPGTGEPLGSASGLVATPREVLHDPVHPSHVELSVESPGTAPTGA